MKKIANNDIRVDDPKYRVFQVWAGVNDALARFENQATLKTFRFLFGESEGARLWQIFKFNCDGSFQKFSSYLTPPQRNELIVNAFYTTEIYAL